MQNVQEEEGKTHTKFPCTQLAQQNFPLNSLMFYLFVDVVFDN